MDTQTVSMRKLGYSFAEAEVATGLSRASLYRAIGRGELRRVKVGNRSLIPAADLEALFGPMNGGRANGPA
jgi:excisionase family DNA binding protein